MEIKKYDWDLNCLLNNKTLDDLFNEWVKQKDKLLDLYPNFYKTEKNFIEWKKENLIFSKISNRLNNYVSNNLNEDINNPTWIGWSQKLSLAFQEFSQKTSDSSNIVIKNKKLINKYLENPDLKDYVRDYKVFFEKQKHVLSEKEEKLLAAQGIVDDGFEDIFSTLVDGTLKFNNVKNKNGKIIKIKSVADFSRLLTSSDAILRKNSWYSFHDAYFKVKDLLVQTLYYNYLMLNTNSKIRKYKNYIDNACSNDEVKVSFVENLYKNIASFKPLAKQYSSARHDYLKHKYKLNKVEPWDASLEITSVNKKYSIEEVQNIALEALTYFGQDYVDIVKKAFDENWISWLPKPNKHSGAYSIGGTYGLDKYFISMNFDKTISSLYTLVHELGHSMHSYYFNQSQTVNASCEIFYAEISSITNEIILSFHLLEKEKTDIGKLRILDELISNFFATTTRQIIFSNFEYEMISKIDNNLPITYESIRQTYYEVTQKYLETSKMKFFNKKYEASVSTILRIPHFYVGNFYVYKYAIGQIPALIAGYKIYNKDQNFINLYKNFLRSGSSLAPIDTIKLLEIDLEKEDVWKEVFNIINKLVIEFKKLSKKIVSKK